MNEQQNPWTLLGEKNIYDNQWIGLTEYDVLNPSGGKGIYGKIHFKNLAIGIIALDNDMNIYLVGQYRFPISQYSWEIPEGGGPFPDDPLDSAKRELLEETGLKAESWTRILVMHLSNSITDEYCEIFLAANLSQHSAIPDETEKLTIKKIPFEEAYKMTQSGEITDSVSVAAIMKVKLMLLEGSLSSLFP